MSPKLLSLASVAVGSVGRFCEGVHSGLIAYLYEDPRPADSVERYQYVVGVPTFWYEGVVGVNGQGSFSLLLSGH